MRARTLLLPVVASLALLAGCTQGPQTPAAPTSNGVENLSADEIKQKVAEAVADAGSFRVSGDMSIDGQAAKVEFVVSDGAMKGTAEAVGIGTVEMIFVNDTVYVKAGEMIATMAGTELPAEVLALIAGKWISLPTGLGMEDSFDLEPDTFMELSGEVTKGEVTEFEGQQVIELKSEDGTMLIALTGEPLPVAMVTEEGTVKFSDWGVSVDVEAPPAADVLDFMQLLALAMGGGIG